jgi:hypothetical protein
MRCISRSLLAAVLAVALLACVRPSPGLAQGTPAPVVRAPKSRLLLPPGSEIVLDEKIDSPELPDPPGIRVERDPMEKVFTLALAEGWFEGAVSLEAAAEPYRKEGFIHPMQPPVWGGAAPGRAPMPGPGRLEGPPQPMVRSAVYNLFGPRGRLVITTIQQGPGGPTRVRVAQMMGNIAPARAVQLSNAVAQDVLGRRADLRGAGGLLGNAPPLPPGAVPHSPVRHVPQADIPLLIQAINGSLPPGMGDPLVALVRQADGVSIVLYRVPRPMSDRDFFEFYQHAGKREGWQLVLENGLRPGAPLVIYQLPEKQGVLSIQAQPIGERRPGPIPGVFVQVPVGTLLTVIQIQGDINVGKAIPGPKREGTPPPGTSSGVRPNRGP